MKIQLWLLGTLLFVLTPSRASYPDPETDLKNGSVSGMYRGRVQTVQFVQDPMYMINTGARYDFAKGKGTMSLNVNDVFNWMRADISAEQPFPQTARFTWESRTLFLGLSYRFGSGKNQALKRKRRDSNTKEGSGGLF